MLSHFLRASTSSAVSFVASSSLTAGSSTSNTINKPTGVVDNDVMVLLITNNSNVSYTLNTPSGWTSLYNNQTIATQRKYSAFYKIAASEGASYTLTTTANASYAAGIVAFRSSTGSANYDVHSVVTNTASTTATANSITVTQDNSAIIYGVFTGSDVGTTITATPPSGMTETVDVTGGTTYKSSLEIAYQTSISAGSTGSKSATLSSSVAYGATLISIKG